MKIDTLDSWIERKLGRKPEFPAQRNTKRIRPSKAPGPDLSSKPIVTYATNAAIPPQNLAYRWLYANTDYLAVPLASAVHKLTCGPTERSRKRAATLNKLFGEAE